MEIKWQRDGEERESESIISSGAKTTRACSNGNNMMKIIIMPYNDRLLVSFQRQSRPLKLDCEQME